MKVECFQFNQTVPWPREVVWQFFSHAGNLAALTPPEAGFEAGVVDGPVYPGQILTHRVKVLPGIKLTWVTEILHVDPGHSFVDGQESGPFRFWRHRHAFVEVPGGTEVRDTVHWALPWDPFSRVALAFVRARLRWLFTFREAALLGALTEVAAARESSCGGAVQPLTSGHGKNHASPLC